MNHLSADDENDLQWLASGQAEAELGVRSWLGPLGDKMRAGTVRCQSSPGEGRDVGTAAERLMRVQRRLNEAEAASPGAARILLAYFSTSDTNGPRNWRALPSFGQLGLVMALMSDDEASDLEKDAARARKGDAGAVARVEALRAKAEGEIERARAAYASTHPPRADDDASRERAGKARAKREGERRGAYAGRVDEGGRVVFATAGARRRAG